MRKLIIGIILIIPIFCFAEEVNVQSKFVQITITTGNILNDGTKEVLETLVDNLYCYQDNSKVDEAKTKLSESLIKTMETIVE